MRRTAGNEPKDAAGPVPAADWLNQEGGRAMHKSRLRKLEIDFIPVPDGPVRCGTQPGTGRGRMAAPNHQARRNLILYQPQVDDWKNYQQVDARMAFTLTPTGGKSHVGVITVQMKSAVNMDDHTVLLSDPQVTSVTFPSLDPATLPQMEQTVKTFLNPAATMTISLDRLVASVKKTKAPPSRDVNNDPPHIFVSMRPAILLLVNGAPHDGAHREFQSSVRRECQLAIVRRAGKFYVLPVRRQRLAYVAPVWEAHGRRPASCPSRCRRSRRMRISPA